MSVAVLLRELEGRLPELEWKIGSLGRALSTKSLPKGLFRLSAEASPSAFILEIKADIDALNKHASEYSGYYLAQRVQQKINVLVTLCHINHKEPKLAHKHAISRICTRKQFLAALEDEINLLSSQHEAMSKRLMQPHHSQGLLTLKSELGEVEKRLTLAKEAFARATKW